MAPEPTVNQLRMLDGLLIVCGAFLSTFARNVDYQLKRYYAEGEVAQKGDFVFLYNRRTGLFESRAAELFWAELLRPFHYMLDGRDIRTACSLIMSERYRDEDFFSNPCGVTTPNGQYVWDARARMYYLRNHSSEWRSNTFAPVESTEPLTNKKLIFRVRNALSDETANTVVETLYKVGRS